MKLIDMDKLLESIKTWYCDKCDNYNGVRCGSCLMDNAIIEIDRQEVVDAVPVVRCRDCYYGKTWENRHGYTGFTCRLFCMDVDPGGFCSYGERRTEND